MAGEMAEKAARKATEKVPSWIERILLPSGARSLMFIL